MWEILKKTFKRNPGDPASGASATKSLSIVAILINLLNAAVKHYTGNELPPDVIVSLNTLLAFLIAYFMRRALPNG